MATFIPPENHPDLKVRARGADASQIYQVAEEWRDNCLLDRWFYILSGRKSMD